MRHHLVWMTAALWLGNLVPAAAVEFVPGFEVGVGWDSNVFGASENEDSGALVEAGPDFRLRQRQGDITYDWIYRLRYEDFPNVSNSDAWEHVADGRSRWQIDDRTSISMQANFARIKSLDRLRGLAGPIDPGLDLGGEIEVGRETLIRHRGNMTFTRDISPRLQLQALVDTGVFDFDDDERTDTISLSGGVQLTRSLTPRLRVGGGVSLLRQDFEETDTRGDRTNTFYQSFGILQYQVAPRMALSVQVGPSWFVPGDEEDDRSGREYALRGTQTNGVGVPLFAASCLIDSVTMRPVVTGACQPAPAVDLVNGGPLITTGLPVRAESISIIPLPFVGEIEDSEDAFNVFGRISLTRQWDTASASLSYQRRANSASGLGTSTNLDIASGSYSWQIDRRWRLRLSGSWQHQESTSDVPQNVSLLADGTGQNLFFDDDGRLVSSAAGARYQVFGVGLVSNLAQLGLIDSAIDVTTYTAQVLVDRRMTERSKVFLLTNYLRQESDSDFRNNQVLDDFRIQLGVNWEFAPIDL